MQFKLNQKNKKQRLKEFHDNLVFLEQISGGKTWDQNYVWLPLPSKEFLAMIINDPKLKLPRNIDLQTKLAYKKEMMNLLRWFNIRIYLFLAKIFYKVKKIISLPSESCPFDQEEMRLISSIQSRTQNIAQNMYWITNYKYYQDIISNG